MTRIQSERLFLREYEEQDLTFYHSWISDDGIMEFLDWKTNTLEETKKRLNLTLSENKKDLESRRCFYFIVGIQHSKELIGNIGIEIDEKDKNLGEIGWVLLPKYRGHGYATEAAQLLINLGFSGLGLSKICAECATENTSSEKIMERLGMSRSEKFEKLYEQKQITREKVKYSLLK